MMAYCEKCGAPIQEGGKFCPECGAPVSEAAAAGTPAAPAQPQPQSTQQYAQPVQQPVRPVQPVQQPQQYAQPAQQYAQPAQQYTQNAAQSRGASPVVRVAPKAKAPVKITALMVAITLLIVAGIFSLISFSQEIGVGQGGAAGGYGDTADIFAPPDPNDPRLPEGAVILSDAILTDIYGEWTGAFQFTRMEGLEAMGATPEQAASMVADALASPKNFEIEYRDGGKWDFNIDFMNGMQLDSNANEEENPQQFLIQAVTQGRFAVNAYSANPDDPAEGAGITMDGICFEDGYGRGIAGSITITMNAGGAAVIEEGYYIVRPAS